jgi:hypothetical protein
VVAHHIGKYPRFVRVLLLPNRLEIDLGRIVADVNDEFLQGVLMAKVVRETFESL